MNLDLIITLTAPHGIRYHADAYATGVADVVLHWARAVTDGTLDITTTAHLISAPEAGSGASLSIRATSPIEDTYTEDVLAAACEKFTGSPEDVAPINSYAGVGAGLMTADACLAGLTLSEYLLAKRNTPDLLVYAIRSIHDLRDTYAPIPVTA